MNGTLLNKLLRLKAKHALYREDGKWYHNLKKFPGVLFDDNGYVIFQTSDEYLSHPKLQRRKDLHIPNGIQSLAQYRRYSLHEKSIVEGIPYHFNGTIPANENTIRVLREIDAILRNQSLVARLKRIYNDSCQICGTRLLIGENSSYSEAHHIIPLGRPHNGKDTLSNMLCVCPNCHVLLDLRAISLNLDSLIVIKHEVSEHSIFYHNSLLKI